MRLSVRHLFATFPAGLAGAGLLLLGPLVWGFIRQAHGLPNFDNDSTAWRLPDRPPVHPKDTETP